MMVPDCCLMVDGWLRVYSSVVKTEALHRLYYRKRRTWNMNSPSGPITLNTPSSCCWHQNAHKFPTKTDCDADNATSPSNIVWTLTRCACSNRVSVANVRQSLWRFRSHMISTWPERSHRNEFCGLFLDCGD